MVKTYAYGFPRIGKNREYKKVIENFWKNKIDETSLISELQDLEKDMESTYSENVDSYPSNEMTMYDKMLDTAIMLGFYDPQNVDEYYELCRGKNALEMTKWFNTNYHNLVPDLSDIETNQQKIVTYEGPFDVNQSYRIVEDLGFVGIKGDANNSESTDILDVMILINAILDDVTLSPEVFWALDLNYSDDINVLDVTKLVHFILFH